MSILKLATIPVVAAVIGYATNWLAVRMTFRPLRFVGIAPYLGGSRACPRSSSRWTPTGSRSTCSRRSSRETDEDQGPERITEEVLRGRFQALIERIIRLLCEDGPQPAIAVRSTPLIGSGEQTLLDNVSLVGEQAGCHLPGRAPVHLDNLCGLGIAERHDEELVGNEDYDLLASRPEVAAAEQEIEEERNQRVAITNGQVRLARLGELLCDVCLREPARTAET